MSEPWGGPAPYQPGTPPPQHYGHPEPALGNALQPYGMPPAQMMPAQMMPAQMAPAMPYAGPPAYVLVGAGGRLGALLLDFLLIMVTFGVGWLIWTVVTWADGQTPAKQLLGHVVADPHTGAPFGWGAMFLREFVIRGLLFGLVNTLTFGVFSFVDAFMVFRADHRTAHDLASGSIVRHR